MILSLTDICVNEIMIFAANVNWLRGKYYYTLAVLSVFLLFFIHTMIRLTYDVHFEAFLELKVSLLLKKPIKNSFLRSTFSNIRFVSISSSGIYTKWSLRRFWTVEKITVLESQNIRFRKTLFKNALVKCDRRFNHFEFEFFWQLKMVEMSNGWNLVMEKSKMICWNLWKTCDMWAANEPNHEKTWIS